MSNNKKVILTPKSSLRAKMDKRKQAPTLIGQFRQSLDSLMKALSACQPAFIRCFKPNSDKESQVFDRRLCWLQLRYSGMMSTIRIRKLGFPILHTFEEFLKRYWVLLRKTRCDPKTETAAACCEAICNTVIEKKGDWKIGRTKVFLKDAHDVVLERLREEELNGIVVVIQRFMRVHKDRKSFLRKRRAAVVLQRHWRANRGDDKREKFLYQQQCAAALTIQTQVRGYLVRKRLKQKREAVILLQAHTRGFLARRAVGKMSNDYESWENIALSLQRGLEDLIESQLENEERELDTEHFLPAPALEVVQEEASDSDKSERRDTPEPAVPDLDPSTSSSEDDSAEFDDENDEFSFSKFSLQHFQGNTNHKHITQRLKQPLLRHDDEGDALACLTVWWIILRFMEDIPEPISQTFTSMLSQKQSRGLSTLVGLEQKKMKKAKKKLRGGIRGASVLPDEPENGTEDGHILIGEGPTLDRPLSPLEKVHIIVGYALSRQDIRDEIYCQICKQLVNNNNRKSRMLGWTLLSICLGIFPPTERFIKYLKSFVSRGPSGYGAYCTERLRRTVANGGRKELPCWIELQAAKSKEPIDVSVSLMDDRTVALHLDSASTSAEVCQAVADKTDLTDTYGFSLYISFCDQMWSLGSCGKHVLDAVSHCEQEMKQQGQQEKDANWSLSICKELFTPWHDCSVDMISTDLIYRQVIKGIKSEVYVSEKEDDYIQLAVKHYYIQFGSAHSEENVQKVVEGCITTTLIENKSMAKWIQLIGSALLQGPYATGIQSRNHVKGEFVDCAREKWPLKFSMFYEVIMMSGPHFPKRRFTVAVNWVGIVFMDGRKTLLDFPYHEVKEFQRISEGHTDGQSVSLATVHGDFVLKCEQAVEMGTLIENTLEGLRHRSVYALAKQDFSRPDDPVFLVCRRGDLLLVEKDKGYSTEEDWIRATNQTTPGTGVVLKEVVQFLPILTRPTDKMLELLSPSWKKQLPAQSVQQRDESVVPVSLKDFALENFRPAGKDGRQGAVKGLNREKLWVYSRDPLKRPLLKSLLNNSELNILACNASTAILKYMGDYPIKLARSPVDLTDQIFGAATQHEALQDEIYCQIMRQMTGNNNRLSVERGWELMWLCSGLFPPSPILIKHAQCFLESRPRAPLAAVCLQRVQEMRRKEPRKLPPHLVEVDAIQKNSTQIFHKIHFPNDTNEICEVTSTTSNKDLCSSIASQLRLSSDDGYSLFLKTPNKITSLEEQKYFFDSLKQTSDLPKKVKKVKEGNPANMPFLVIFKRKLWFNVIPGKDLVADLTFHFPQELSKYLQGYHSCTKEDMITLAGLLFRCKVDSDRSQFVMIPRMLKELIPADQFKIMSTEEWKKHIISSYNKQSGITVQEAKIAFLKAISSWTTFGCAFFQVKQTCESSYPNTVLIAISKQGVSLIDPDNKTLLVMHPFTRITAYHSKDSSFVMTTGTAVRGNIFVCETSQAHTMEDLLRSYVSMYERQRQAFRPRLNLMFT